MSVLSTLLGNYGDDLAKAAGKVAAANTDDLAKVLARNATSKIDDEAPKLARQMFDENGNRIKFYHGTPSGGFEKFNDVSYFTPNKWYADMYQNPQASSISYGKVADNPMTYETYLDIRKPFDLSDRKARDIYINDYIKGGNAVGINPYQSSYNDIKNIDWTEVENLVDFLKENNYDYDAIIADEGGFFDNSGKVVSRGKSYIPFSGSQVSILQKILGSK